MLQEQEVSRANDGRLTDLLADNLYAGRTMKYYADLENKIKDQTPETVLAALKKYVDPKRLVIVVAGDFKEEQQAASKEQKSTNK